MSKNKTRINHIWAKLDYDEITRAMIYYHPELCEHPLGNKIGDKLLLDWIERNWMWLTFKFSNVFFYWIRFSFSKLLCTMLLFRINVTKWDQYGYIFILKNQDFQCELFEHYFNELLFQHIFIVGLVFLKCWNMYEEMYIGPSLS